MFRLLNIELHKLRYNRSAKILISTYFILITFIALIASIEFDLGPVHFRLADQGIFNFPFIWHFNSYIGALLKIFLAIVIVSMMSNEYSHRTLKQNLIDGLSKREFVLSKFLTVLLFSVVSSIFLVVVTLILGYSFSDYTEIAIVFSDMEYLLGYFVKLLGFFTFCMFIGILIKRSAFALGFLFIWWIFENILFGVLKFRFFKDTDIAENTMQFFPLSAMSNIVVEPFSRLNFIKTAATQIGEELDKDYSVHWYQLLIVLVWTAIFVYLSFALLKKRDL